MILASLRLVPHIIVLLTGSCRGVVAADLARWAEILRMPQPSTRMVRVITFIQLMAFTPEFRNVFYMRVGAWSFAFSWMCPRMRHLSIVADSIGPGLFIQHGECTFVSAHSIGANCWIGRLVVIGYSNDTDHPTIGDNVRIFAGAKIIGDIVIGDNATIGLNTVVTQSVAPNTTVLGVPGRVIWRAAPPAELVRPPVQNYCSETKASVLF
jgi:serine O-acetyltransferase